MKRKITVRLHLRRTKRGPKIIRKHPRLVRAKMAEWSSPEEREYIKEELERIKERSKEGPDSVYKGGLIGFEHALKMSGLETDEGELKPFKRARMANFKKLPSREFMDEEPRYVDVPVEMKTQKGNIKKYWPTYNRYGKFLGFEYER